MMIICRVQTYPGAWALALMQPLNKGGREDRHCPASYCGIYLLNMPTKLFEGLIESRLSQFTWKYDTPTSSQQGSRTSRQIHDAIYAHIATFQHNIQNGITSYCCLDFATAYPSVHRYRLARTLKNYNIKIWHLLEENSRKVRIRILRIHCKRWWRRNPLWYTWGQQTEPNPFWHLCWRTDSRTARKTPRIQVCQNHISGWFQLDRSTPLRRWHGPHRPLYNTAPANSWSVPTIERTQPYENQPWKNKDHGFYETPTQKAIQHLISFWLGPKFPDQSPWSTPTRRTQRLHIPWSKTWTSPISSCPPHRTHPCTLPDHSTRPLLIQQLE